MWNDMRTSGTLSLIRSLRRHSNNAAARGVRLFSSRSSSAPDPPLVKIPSLPGVGSMFPKFYSGIPPIDMSDPNSYFRRVHQDHGPFYSIGIPGLGSGLHGTIYVIRDPVEMQKLIRQQGPHPSGLVETEWAILAWMKKVKYSSSGLFQRGAEWKRLRTFMQKDLLSPASARGYLPAILKGAAGASQKALQYQDDDKLDVFFNYSAMDMYAEVLFGGPAGMPEADYRKFCNASIEGMRVSVELMLSPLEAVAYYIGLFQTPRLKKYIDCFTLMDEIARPLFQNFIDRAERNELTDREKDCYFYKLVQKQPGSDVTQKEMIELALLTMIASVDTTASKTKWTFLQLALHQNIQQELYEQLDRAVQKTGGALTPAVFNKADVPLLPAVVRETFRCTPPVFAHIIKTVDAPTRVHGVTIPAGSTILFDSLANPWDPNLVQDPMTFRPERWFKGAVEARKGTPAAIMDHPFYAGPFSTGARRCPGSRVAELEEQALIAQLVLDWQIDGPKNDLHWKDVSGTMQQMYVPHFPEEVRFVPRS